MRYDALIDDLKNEILKNGLTICDFQLNNVDLSDWDAQCDNKILGKVIIKRKSSGKQKSYAIYTKGIPFIIDFVTDLKCGYFN